MPLQILKLSSKVLAPQAERLLTQMSPRTQHLINTIPGFEKTLRNLTKEVLPEKKFLGYGNHPNAIQVALGATSDAPVVIPAFKGYGKPLPTFIKHTGGWNWASSDPLVAKEYHLIDVSLFIARRSNIS